MYLDPDYNVEVGMPLSYPHVSYDIVVKVGSTQSIGHHMFGPEGHLSI